MSNKFLNGITTYGDIELKNGRINFPNSTISEDKNGIYINTTIDGANEIETGISLVSNGVTEYTDSASKNVFSKTVGLPKCIINDIVYFDGKYIAATFSWTNQAYGIYYSYDGQHWQPSTLSTGRIQRLCVCDTEHGQILLAAYFGKGFKVSKDGINWTTTNTADTSFDVSGKWGSVAFGNGLIVAGDDNGVYDGTTGTTTIDKENALAYSTLTSTADGTFNAGAWTRVNVDGKGIHEVSFINNTWFIGTTAGLYITSTPAATFSTWRKVLESSAVFSIIFSEEANAYFIGTDNGVFKSTDLQSFTEVCGASDINASSLVARTLSCYDKFVIAGTEDNLQGLISDNYGEAGSWKRFAGFDENTTKANYKRIKFINGTFFLGNGSDIDMDNSPESPIMFFDVNKSIATIADVKRANSLSFAAFEQLNNAKDYLEDSITEAVSTKADKSDVYTKSEIDSQNTAFLKKESSGIQTVSSDLALTGYVLIDNLVIDELNIESLSATSNVTLSGGLTVTNGLVADTIKIGDDAVALAKNIPGIATSSVAGIAKYNGKGVSIDNAGTVNLKLRTNHSGIEFENGGLYVQTSTTAHPTAGTVAPVATDTAGKLVVPDATSSTKGGVKLATGLDDTGAVSVMTASQIKSVLPDITTVYTKEESDAKYLQYIPASLSNDSKGNIIDDSNTAVGKLEYNQSGKLFFKFGSEGTTYIAGDSAGLSVQIKDQLNADTFYNIDFPKKSGILVTDVDLSNSNSFFSEAISAQNEKIEALESQKLTLVETAPATSVADANIYGFYGNLKAFGINGGNVDIRELSIKVRTSGTIDNANVPVWARILKNVNNTWVIAAQSVKSHTWSEANHGEFVTFEMKQIGGNAISAYEKVAIVFVNNESAAVNISNGTFGVSNATGLGGGALVSAIASTPNATAASASVTPILKFKYFQFGETEETLKLTGGTLTGALKMPTPAVGTNNTTVATTAFVNTALSGYVKTANLPDFATFETVSGAEGKYAQKSTTLAGYNITDAYTKSEIDSKNVEFLKKESSGIQTVSSDLALTGYVLIDNLAIDELEIESLTASSKVTLSGGLDVAGGLVADSIKVGNDAVALAKNIPNVSSFITKDVSNLTNYETKTTAEGKYALKTDISNVYKYIGSVDVYSALPTTGQKAGDVYNIVNADDANNISAGDNVAWTGSSWDKLGGSIDLSNYALQSSVDALKPENSKLDVDCEIIDGNGQSLFVYITTNDEWTLDVSDLSSWNISGTNGNPIPTSGTGKSLAVITIPKNPWDYPRAGTITLTVGTNKYNSTITQLVPVEFLDIRTEPNEFTGSNTFKDATYFNGSAYFKSYAKFSSIPSVDFETCNGTLSIENSSPLESFGFKITKDNIERYITLPTESGTIALTSDIPDITGKADKSTTLAGYGITNAYTKTEADGKFITKDVNNLTNYETKTVAETKYALKEEIPEVPTSAKYEIPAKTPSSNKIVWTITLDEEPDVAPIMQVFNKNGDVVYANITYAAGVITVVINSTNACAEGDYYIIVSGQTGNSGYKTKVISNADFAQAALDGNIDLNTIYYIV